MRCDVDVRSAQTVRRPGGTRCYLSPEAVQHKPVGAPTDWWALGVVVYEALTGWAPFAGTAKEVGDAICNARIRFPQMSDELVDAAGAPVLIGGDAVSLVRKLLTKQVEGRLGNPRPPIPPPTPPHPTPPSLPPSPVNACLRGGHL